MSKIKLYRHALSGHSHRAELMLSLPGLEAELIDTPAHRGTPLPGVPRPVSAPPGSAPCTIS